MRLIDADRLERVMGYWRTDLIISYGENDEFVKCLNLVCEKIHDAPTINAERIKQGRWTVTPLYIKCSECGESFMLIPQNYCPTCGAVMED